MSDEMKEALADKSRVLSDVEKDFFGELFYNLSKMKIDQSGALDDNGIPFRHAIQDFIVAWIDYLSKAPTEDTGGERCICNYCLDLVVRNQDCPIHGRLSTYTDEPKEKDVIYRADEGPVTRMQWSWPPRGATAADPDGREAAFRKWWGGRIGDCEEWVMFERASAFDAWQAACKWMEAVK